MDTAQLLMLIGISVFTAALLALVFMLGRWSGERAAARAHVAELESTRQALERQRYYLEQQRVSLAYQRETLDGRRTRMPDSGRARVPREDDTREIDYDASTYGRPDQWITLPDHLNKRRHRSYDEEN